MEKNASPPPPGFTTDPMQPSSYAPPPNYGAPPPTYTDGQPNVVIVGARQFGPESQPMVCPHCHKQISTRVESESSSKTHLFALLLCVFGLWCCAPCPYCIDSCMLQNHYCPSCNAFLGKSDN